MLIEHGYCYAPSCNLVRVQHVQFFMNSALNLRPQWLSKKEGKNCENKLCGWNLKKNWGILFFVRTIPISFHRCLLDIILFQNQSYFCSTRYFANMPANLLFFSPNIKQHRELAKGEIHPLCFMFFSPSYLKKKPVKCQK